MNYHTWTIRFPKRVDIARVTTLEGVKETLRLLDLPGAATPDLIVHGAQMSEHNGRAEYIHDENGPNEWSLTWTKFSEVPPLLSSAETEFL